MSDTQIMETPSRLKKLALQSLSELRHVWGKNSEGVLIFSNLQEVVVNYCRNLQTLFPASLAKNLEKLEKLEIGSCHKLQAIYLFTSSAAKKLVNLEYIIVVDCKSVTEIVAREGDEDEDEHKGEGEDKYENEMMFKKLQILFLDSLPKIESIYTGCSTLNFPSLELVEFIRCYSTELFRPGDKVPTELKVKIDGLYWEDDINYAIMQQFDEETA
uniref:Disease resistance protein At4g27190-like leucine-rich repeats domain-containing protein n=1 Tax=Cajanus cajan TaxID=3821 RepID=A0A151UCF0_CAJCA|nr:hypothetical protein KK1_021256 [Cajanus cajan]